MKTRKPSNHPRRTVLGATAARLRDISISLTSIAKLLAVLGMAGPIAVEPKRSKEQVA